VRASYAAVAAFFAAVAVATAVTTRQSDELPLRGVADVVLTGDATRFDYQSIDSLRHLLFIAHLGDSSVIAVDLKRPHVITTIPNVSRAHGVLAVPQRGVVYASATGTNEVVAIDERTFKIVARAPAGIYPDGIAFEPRTGRLFISDEHGRTETVIDTHTNQRIATISLGGDVGNSQYDPTSGHIFVNVQTLGELVEIKPQTNTVVRRIRVTATGCAGNHGLLIDASRNQAFIACEDSAQLVLLDLATRQIIQTWAAGENPDVLAFDDTMRRLFVAAESGVVSIFSDRQGITKTAQAFFAPAAHTVAVDQSTHLVYFPLENVSGVPRLRVMAVSK
jgi:DNA-binding beta-propeller fold protein YncE